MARGVIFVCRELGSRVWRNPSPLRSQRRRDVCHDARWGKLERKCCHFIWCSVSRLDILCVVCFFIEKPHSLAIDILGMSIYMLGTSRDSLPPTRLAQLYITDGGRFVYLNISVLGGQCREGRGYNIAQPTQPLSSLRFSHPTF